jgi:hypothetical protein
LIFFSVFCMVTYPYAYKMCPSIGSEFIRNL